MPMPDATISAGIKINRDSDHFLISKNPGMLLKIIFDNCRIIDYTYLRKGSKTEDEQAGGYVDEE